jgi:hypothetical protein
MRVSVAARTAQKRVQASVARTHPGMRALVDHRCRTPDKGVIVKLVWFSRNDGSLTRTAARAPTASVSTVSRASMSSPAVRDISSKPQVWMKPRAGPKGL